MSGDVDYSVTVTDWTQPRGYKNSGRGWRVRCFSMPRNDWNAMGHTVYEHYFKSEAKARDAAKDLADTYGVTVTS